MDSHTFCRHHVILFRDSLRRMSGGKIGGSMPYLVLAAIVNCSEILSSTYLYIGNHFAPILMEQTAFVASWRYISVNVASRFHYHFEMKPMFSDIFRLIFVTKTFKQLYSICLIITFLSCFQNPLLAQKQRSKKIMRSFRQFAFVNSRFHYHFEMEPMFWSWQR